MLTQAQIDELSSGAYGLVTENELLSGHTSLGIGGPCDMLIEPTSEKELIRNVRYLRAQNIPFYILGNGTNVLVLDGGYPGVVIKLGKQFSDCLLDSTVIYAQAGATLAAVSKMSFRAQLTGMEDISGIPGTVGGGVIMNAGAYEGEMKDCVKKVRAIDKEGQIVELSNEQCEFEYRNSRLQREGMIVLEVVFELEKGDQEKIDARFQDVTERRTSKQPLDKKSAGSTFKRPVGGYASKLIDDCGLRGHRFGGAQVSEKHCGFLLNENSATAKDMLGLIDYVQREVKKQYNIDLEPEVRIIGNE